MSGILNLSKRTNLYLTWARVSNEKDAQYDYFNEGGVSDTTIVGRGADPTGIMFGVAHFF